MDGLGVLVDAGGVFVLTGAGMSTASGIPAYRGFGAGDRAATPMTTQVFDGSGAARQRYWARSHVGWARIGDARPNAGHLAVADLQAAGRLASIVTQNVDGLHTAAGARDVVELHGNLARVVCLDCGARSSRVELHRRLDEANVGWSRAVDGAAGVRPDGDVELGESAVATFRIVGCTVCGGVLKPDVVFFGGTVERGVVESTYADLEASRGLLVLGSSLTVMSGYRFVLRAAKLGLPVAIVGLGATRGDHLATVRVEEPLEDVLPRLAARYVGTMSDPSVPAATIGA